MNLTDPEKLMLIMLSEIHEKLGIKDGVDAKFVQSAIYSDNTWGLRWKFTGIFTGAGEPTPPFVREVVDILDMWSFLESAFARLTPEEKKRLATEAAPFGDDVKFRGFDGNNETEHMSVARFLIDDLGRFESFKGRDLNAHMPTLDMHQRMFAVFKPMRASLADRRLDVDSLIKIIKGSIHPDYKK